MSTTAPLSNIPLAPGDPILGMTDAFKRDTNPAKVNLGVGVYQDSNGKTPLLRVVQEMQRRITTAGEPRVYLPIDGLAEYDKNVQKLVLGAESKMVQEGRAVTIQTLGGTGALRVGGDFLRKFLPNAELWLSDPSWENHQAIFERAGFTVRAYPYYDAKTNGVKFSAMTEMISKIPLGSVVLLHACCHNPTGVDLSRSQWQELATIFKERSLVAFLDLAYQGFSEGIDEDAYAVRLFADAGITMVAATSFSKSFSLYGERVGALTVTAPSAEEAKAILSQLKVLIRTNYSNPPTTGAALVAGTLGDPELMKRWITELGEMRERIRSMRTKLVEGLAATGIDRDFRFINDQRGMFSYSGITGAQALKLREEKSIYILDSGRLCVAALNDENLLRVCAAIAETLRAS